MAVPTHMSIFPEGTDLTAAHLGATMQGLPLYEQGLNVARVLEAVDENGFPIYPTTAVLMPRRSTKTTAIWSVLLGRCATIPGYKVATTAQDGTRAGQRMREVMRTLEAHGYVENGTLLCRYSNGRERIEFTNGSVIWVVAPSASAFRGEAADCLLFDEAGELDVDKSADLLAGALPLLDTRPRGQVIIAGTPGTERTGLLWGTLHNDDGSVGVLDYSIRDDEECVTVDEETGALIVDDEILKRVHPGIGTLTTLAKIKAHLKTMGRAAWEREYLCRFPFDSSVKAVSMTAWCAGVSDFVERPERVGLGFAVEKDAGSATLVAAWRDEDGVAYIEVIEHKMGFQWLADCAAKMARKYRSRIGYDAIGANHQVAEAMGRMRPIPQMLPKNMKQMIASAATLVADINGGRVKQFDQGALFAAVDGAVWRMTEGGRLFNSGLSTKPVGPLIAASAALHTYDNLPAQRETVIISA